MVLHLEFKFMITHFVYVGAHGIFQVSSWKSFFAFYLLIFTEDEVSMEFKSEDVIGSFLSNFTYIFEFRIWHFMVIQVHGMF